MSNDAAKLHQKLTIETIEAAQEWADQHGEAVDISITRNGNVVAGRLVDALAHSTIKPHDEAVREALMARMAMVDRMLRKHRSGERTMSKRLAEVAHRKTVHIFMEWARRTGEAIAEGDTEF